jgi:hypothetical protein
MKSGLVKFGDPGMSAGAAVRSPAGEYTSALEGAESTWHISWHRRRLVARAAKTGGKVSSTAATGEPLQ